MEAIWFEDHMKCGGANTSNSVTFKAVTVIISNTNNYMSHLSHLRTSFTPKDF